MAKERYNMQCLSFGQTALREYRFRHGILNCMRIEQIRRAAGERVHPRVLPSLGMAKRFGAYRNLSDEELANAIEYLTQELSLVEQALASLPRDMSGPATDLYIHGVTWAAVSMKWYITESGLSRRMRRAAERIGFALMPDVRNVQDVAQLLAISAKSQKSERN